MKFVLVSGRSGSGKNTALHMLEDLGFYCVDNLPTVLIATMAEKLQENAYSKIAVGIDARNTADNLSKISEHLDAIPANIDKHVIYIDSRDEVLIKRFAETRRKHPLSSKQISLTEALRRESQLLEPIASRAHLTIDTSDMNLHELRAFIKTRLTPDSKPEADTLSILFQSFGYKKNIPIDSDIVFDVRCLPNPHWQEELRPFTGNDEPIKDFLLGNEEVHHMLDDIYHHLKKWIPKYEATDRRYLTISIGCTGGKHRSVFFANELQQRFSQLYSDVKVRHRQLDNLQE